MIPNFQDPQTRVRINPKTTMTFLRDPMVLLDHPNSDQGVQIQPDIMLVLYGMTDWTTVGDLCQGWPPDDQQKIMSHLQMMYQSNLVVTDEEELKAQLQNIPADAGSAIHINIENHHAMLSDQVRTRSYQRAIEQAVTEDSVVIDLGCGSGILSFFAARKGAQKVYAIERRPDMVQVARELARENNLSDKITFIEGISHQIPPEVFDPKPNLIVSEILGNAIFEEHVLEFTLDARDRFLAPGGKLLPSLLDIKICAFDSGIGPDKEQEISELEAAYGFKLQLMKTILTQKSHMKLERLNLKNVTMMSKPVTAISLDLMTLTETHFKQNFTWTATKDGFVNGFCAYFEAHLDEDTILTNSPWAPKTHWTQVMFIFPDRREVKTGDTIEMTFEYDGGLSIWYADDWTKK